MCSVDAWTAGWARRRNRLGAELRGEGGEGISEDVDPHEACGRIAHARDVSSGEPEPEGDRACAVCACPSVCVATHRATRERRTAR